MEDLIYLYSHVDLFLVIFCRFICAVAFLPIVEESKVPPLALTGICACMTMITLLVGGDMTLIYEPNLFSFTIVIVKECVVGLILGFALRIYFQIYYFVGNLLSTQGGLGMSMVMDPVSAAQVPLVGKLYNLTFSAIFVLTGGYHWFIRTLIESFEVIPVNQAIFRAAIVGSIVQAVVNYFLIGFKLAAPILGVLIIIDCGLGVLARTVPQMNMFVIGIPLKMLILFILMVMTISFLPIFNNIIIDDMVNTIMNLIQGMIPT